MHFGLNCVTSAFAPISREERGRSSLTRLLLVALGSALALAILPLLALVTVPWRLLWPPRLAVSSWPPQPRAEAPRSLDVLSANLCLLPDFASRFSGVANTVQRAWAIGRLLASSRTGSMSDSPASTAVHSAVPNADIICLQEVFDSEANRALTETLKRTHPFIVSTVTSKSALTLFPSGLLLASRVRKKQLSHMLSPQPPYLQFPVVEAWFQMYDSSSGFDALACKGALMVKVHMLASEFFSPSPLDIQIDLATQTDKRDVAFVCTTHLQAGRDSGSRQRQLDQLSTWFPAFIQALNFSPTLLKTCAEELVLLL